MAPNMRLAKMIVLNCAKKSLTFSCINLNGIAKLGYAYQVSSYYVGYATPMTFLRSPTAKEIAYTVAARIPHLNRISVLPCDKYIQQILAAIDCKIAVRARI